MAESIIIDQTATKAKKYEQLLPQVNALVMAETDTVANLANIAAALKYGMGFFWVGFYLAKEGELVLGPFQGPIACTRIRFDKGVCGVAFSQQKTIIVEDVDQFPGHIACSSESKSEIVVPVWQKGKVTMVLDVDSNQLADFDATDQHYLEKLVAMLDR